MDTAHQIETLSDRTQMILIPSQTNPKAAEEITGTMDGLYVFIYRPRFFKDK